MAEFAGKRFVITGGAGGIGVATARRLLEHGAHVLLVDLDADRLTTAREALGGTRVFTLVSDLATPAACVAVMEGAKPVYALVHLAGLFERDPLLSEEHGVWDRAIAANLTNAYDMAVASAPVPTRARRRAWCSPARSPIAAAAPIAPPTPRPKAASSG